jgi:hypothetical protein
MKKVTHRARGAATTALLSGLLVAAIPALSAPAHAAIGPGCGSACNGKSATYVYNGERCVDSAIKLASANAIGGPITKAFASVQTWTFQDSGVDPYVQANWYYSVNCQTMWVDVRTTNAIARTSFAGVTAYRTNTLLGRPCGAVLPGQPLPTANAGWKRYPMIDDHSIPGCSLAQVSVSDGWSNHRAQASVAY